MPLDALQRDVVALLRSRRSPESFLGGSSVFNLDFPRSSADLDIYVEGASLADVAAADMEVLRASGLRVVADNIYGLVIEATVSRGAEQTLIEWNEADRQRFFPAQEDPTFGWILHRLDLAAQKLVAAATRRKARDVVDLLLINAFYVPLAATAFAAPAKLSGASPTALLDLALRNCIGNPQEDFEALKVEAERLPFEMEGVKLAFADQIRQATDVVIECTRAAPGHFFLDPGTGMAQVPTNDALPRLVPRTVSERGAFPQIGRDPRLQGHLR